MFLLFKRCNVPPIEDIKLLHIYLVIWEPKHILLMVLAKGNQTLAKVAASKGEGGLLSGAKCLTLTSHPQLMV